MPTPLRVLIVEDNPADAELVVREMRRAGFAPEWTRVDTEADYLGNLVPELDVILSDYEMPEFSGLRALELLRERLPDIPFIIVSGTIGEDTAVAAMKEGAIDYLIKDRLTRLGPAIEHALREGCLRRERKAADTALRESETRFRQLAENIHDVFWLRDVSQNRILYVSPAYERIWGRPCGDLYISPHSWKEAIHPEDRERVQTAATTQLNELYDEEYRVIRPDGSLRWVRDRAYPVANASGTICRVVGVARDVTRQKEAEARVREQASMLDLAREAIVVRDIHSRQITFWNKGAERLYGWTAAEAVGRDIGDLIFIDSEGPDAITLHLLEHGDWHGEVKHLSKEGKRLTVSVRATLVRDSAGNPRSALVIYFDVTEQKNLEARFLRAQRLESIGTLASGVAHDLNNILAPIMMSAPLLRENLDAQSREGIISSIETCAERGAQIIKQVLTFGRGVEGKRCPLQVGALVDEIAKIICDTFPKSLSIQRSIDPQLSAVVGDSTQLHQVLLNLCVNARDAMPDGGSLQLRAVNVDLDAHFASMVHGASPGPHVLLEVTDTGTGMSQEIVDRIFDPFFSTKSAGAGTGLGLSTVLGIVKTHGGFIHVISAIGEGTTFQIYLPASEESEAAPSPAASTPMPRGHGQLVLVVDDEPAIREAACKTLQNGGYEVLLAAHGTEALGVFAMNAGRVALVVTGLMMPFLDGVALTRVLRSMAPHLPIIASTGLAERPQIAQLRQLGVEHILNKPYRAETLLRAIHEALPQPTPADRSVELAAL